MKRNKMQRKPVWQDQPMDRILILMNGWEVLKKGREVIKDCPDQIAVFHAWRDGLPPEAQLYVGWMDSIIPAARAEVAAWLRGRELPAEAAKEAVVASASRVPATVFLVIVRLWERFLAVGELGGREDQTRWLSEKSREEQLLLTRLSKRITLPIS